MCVKKNAWIFSISKSTYANNMKKLYSTKTTYLQNSPIYVFIDIESHILIVCIIQHSVRSCNVRQNWNQTCVTTYILFEQFQWMYIVSTVVLMFYNRLQFSVTSSIDFRRNVTDIITQHDRLIIIGANIRMNIYYTSLYLSNTRYRSNFRWHSGDYVSGRHFHQCRFYVGVWSNECSKACPEATVVCTIRGSWNGLAKNFGEVVYP